MIEMVLDLEELEEQPTNKIPGFYERIQSMIPSLYSHRCSEGHEGGFFERVKDGTWMGHVIEHIALEIQSLADMKVGFGRTRSIDKYGQYHVVFEYIIEGCGRYAAEAAVSIARALIKGEQYDLEKDLQFLKETYLHKKPGASTQAIVEEAKKRNIPILQLNEESLFQLGYGINQRRIQASLSQLTSAVGVDIACDKEVTKSLLHQASIPVPEGTIIQSPDELEEVLNWLPFPLAIKPLNGNQGKGATINIHSIHEARQALYKAQEYGRKVIIEQSISGQDFRALVINGKFIAASLRTPPIVTGDGIRTIEELVADINSDPRRGNEHDNVLTRIELNDCSLKLIRKQGYEPDMVLPKGKQLLLKTTANLSTGGTAKDVTDLVHPTNKLLFERVARIIGLDICGIDLIAKTLESPIKENGGVVLEVNAAPGLRMHLFPSEGRSRNVAAPIIDMLFPNGSNGRIPIIAITGTNGKTTTTRLSAHIIKQTGKVVGFTTTDGVYIGDEMVMQGDCSGPSSAQIILKDPIIEAAVLECARGGMLRSGLGFENPDVAIITNIDEDHLGIDNINTIEQLAHVKSILAEAVPEYGYAVLNADDERVYAIRKRVHSNVALFSIYGYNEKIVTHCSEGGIAMVRDGNNIVLIHGDRRIPIDQVSNIPLAFGGHATFNVYNIMAAALANYVSGVPVELIRKGLQSFSNSPEQLPGRANIFDMLSYRVMVDYAHNPHGIRFLGQLIEGMEASRKVGIIAGVGDRRNEDIISVGRECAKIFDEVIIRHDADLRGRTMEDVTNLLMQGIRQVKGDILVKTFTSEKDSLDHALTYAIKNSLVVILVEDPMGVIQYLKRHQQKLMGSRFKVA